MLIPVTALFALGFYRDALDVEVRADVSSEGFRWVTVGARGRTFTSVLIPTARRSFQAEGDALMALLPAGIAGGGDLPLR